MNLLRRALQRQPHPLHNEAITGREKGARQLANAGTGKSQSGDGTVLAAAGKSGGPFTTAAALVNELVEAKQNGQVRLPHRAMAEI